MKSNLHYIHWSIFWKFWAF